LKGLSARGFRAVVVEPYTLRRGLVVGLYAIHSPVYMDGGLRWMF